MILHFPTIETFVLVVRNTEWIPEKIKQSACELARSTTGLSLSFEGTLPKNIVATLRSLNIHEQPTHQATPKRFNNWLQAIPLERISDEMQITPTTPVLFDLPSEAAFAKLTLELLRLGNDRISFRVLSRNGNNSYLMRVIGPPYYTLLSVIDDQQRTDHAPGKAYYESAPQVWVEYGYRHRLSGSIVVNPGQFILVDAAQNWISINDSPFQDVYQYLSFDCGTDRHVWRDQPITSKLTVPLRLVRSSNPEVAELWILRSDATSQLERFIHNADYRLIQRLKFAVGTNKDGEKIVALQVIPSKLPTPHLNIESAISYRSVLKLPNFFLPIGHRLHPLLRRDIIRKLFAEDTDQLVWLHPQESGGFVPESLPLDAFRSLEDWVVYVSTTNRVVLNAWAEAITFDFENFVCREPAGKPGKDSANQAVNPKASDRVNDVPLSTHDSFTSLKSPGVAETPATPTSSPSPATGVRLPSEWVQQRKKLEEHFIAIEGALDQPERVRLWSELAEAYSQTGEVSEAALCWLNALWFIDPLESRWLESWVKTEAPEQLQSLSESDLDKRLAQVNPTPAEARQVIAFILQLVSSKPVTQSAISRIAQFQQFLEENEGKLPVRAVWLVAMALARLSGNDTLGLARIRDRILHRLLEEGHNAERNLPGFLRFADTRNSDRARHIKERLGELHRTVRDWTDRSLKSPPPMHQAPSEDGATLAYIDLLFAFAMAKFGETTTAYSLMENAKKILYQPNTETDRGISGTFLYQAFVYRIEQAMAEKPHTGSLQPALLERLEVIQKLASPGKNENPYRTAYYPITRLRDQSRVIEPQEKFEPYNDYMKENDPFKRALSELRSVKDPNILTKRIRELYRSGTSGKATTETRFQTVLAGLPLSARVGESFSVEMVQLIPEVIKPWAVASNMGSADRARTLGMLLERGLYLAAHYDRHDLVQLLVGQFIELLRLIPDEPRFELINIVATQCIKSLRKLGLRDTIDQLLGQLQAELLRGETANQLRDRFATKADLWSKSMQSLLNLASGWMMYGMTEQAEPIIKEIHSELIAQTSSRFTAKDFTALTQAYVAALGHSASENGIDRIIELFRQINPSRVTNGWTTAKFYSRFHFNLAEETVLAVISDDLALGASGQRWLEDDEYIVRNRIHRDMRSFVAKSNQ